MTSADHVSQRLLATDVVSRCQKCKCAFIPIYIWHQVNESNDPPPPLHKYITKAIRPGVYFCCMHDVILCVVEQCMSTVLAKTNTPVARQNYSNTIFEVRSNCIEVIFTTKSSTSRHHHSRLMTSSREKWIDECFPLDNNLHFYKSTWNFKSDMHIRRRGIRLEDFRLMRTSDLHVQILRKQMMAVHQFI
jgi:hypothetical protein